MTRDHPKGGAMSGKKGFTLAEILITIAILGVVAAVAVPGFSKAKTSAEKNQAINYLRTVRTSMKMYYGKWKNYIPLSNTSQIKSALGAETQASGYTFAVSSAGAATATRTSDGKTATLNPDGTWSGNIEGLPAS